MSRDHPLMPFAVALGAVALFSLMDALMKGAALAVGAYSALLLRNAIGFVLIAPAWLGTRGAWPAASVMRLHMTRAVVSAAMAFTFFWGIARIPLAEAIALSFVAPLIALYLAALVLGERVRPRAVGASLFGLGGVAAIIFTRLGEVAAPDHDEANWGIASILVSSLLYAWNLVLARQQALVARPVEVAAFQTGLVGLVLLPFAPFVFEVPGRDAWPMIAASAVLALAASLLLAWAYRRAETQVLVPLEYSGFLWAALFGWLFFDEGVRPSVAIGAVLIVAACWIAAPRGRPEQTSA